jgi:hypothetical protein
MKGLLVAFALLALMAGACGKKGAPRAPEVTVPEAIQNLRAEREPQGVVLSWDRPTRHVDGKEIRDLAAFVIYRREISEGCPECPTVYRERATVDVEDQEKFLKQKRFRYVDREVQERTLYRYRVLSQLADGSRSDPSNEAEAGGSR